MAAITTALLLPLLLLVLAGTLQLGALRVSAARVRAAADLAALIAVNDQDEAALVRTGDGSWEVMGAGSATVYRNGAQPKTAKKGSTIELGAVATRR